VHVDVREGRFRERLLPLRDADVRARLAREGRARLPRGQIVDVAPALEAFVRDAARLADPGFLVLVDYGDVAERLFDPSRLNGTLAVYRSHGRHHDPYEELGRRDLTADVDFTAVELAALEAGMEPLGLATQGAFLEALGVDEREFVAKPTSLGTAFLVFAARRGTRATLPGFG
jgi:SAM-dependent MidA family methyltransferase